MRNKYYIIAIVLILISFVLFLNRESSLYSVLSINSPIEIVVDLNRNGEKDNNETIVLDNLSSFSIHAYKNYDKQLSSQDYLSIGYLAENFAKDTLEGQKVKVENGDIIINGTRYSQLLLDNGFAIKKGDKLSDSVLKNIDKAKKLNLIILNNKNNKFHNLDCEYGQQASNIIILPKSQLPKDAVACKSCIDKKNNDSKTKNKTSKYKNLMLTDENITLILSDMTANLKPNNNCTDRICKALLKEINSASNTIDFAIYGYSKIPEIEKALIKAKERGVKIRFVFDEYNKSNIYPDTYYLASLFENHNSDTARAIMHNKFFIFDNKKVFTGSANLSNTDMSGFSSNAVIILNSPDLASLYLKEFEQMYMGKFHEQKSKIEKLNKSKFRVYFSPADDIILKEIIPLINNSKKYIYIPAFVLTHTKMANALIEAKERGVDVKIILDATNTKSPSKIEELRKANIPVKTENYAGKLHSKSIIIDDKYLLIGSMNFSVSGALYNDENVLIIENEKLTKFYKEYFNYFWKQIPDKWLKYNARAESVDSIGSCQDGIDNDYDGDIDLKDSGCVPYTKSK